jgi:uncharacterized cofD-like protein
MADKHIVVLGGGNGTSRLLTTLMPLLQDDTIASLHALVHMSDDGGSTGRLREQYGVAAVGDLTRCLLALSELRGDVRGDLFLKALEFRFTTGDFQGHTLRNIFLTALEKTSDIDSAISTMARVLHVPKFSGVVPTTLKTLTERVEIKRNGDMELLGEGEHFIAHNVNLQIDSDWKPGDVRVTFAEPDVPLNPRAAEVLAAATHIIIAPGHTYGTILPTLALPALGEAVAHQAQAQLIVAMTLLTTPRQTTGWTGENFVRVYESYLYGRTVDTVIANTGRVSVELVEGQGWVTFTESEHPYRLLAADLVSTEQPVAQAGDVVPRAIIIHDPAKLGQVFRDILK